MTANPSTVTSLVTPALEVTCRVPAAVTSDDFRYLSSIVVLHEGKDLAMVSERFDAELLTQDHRWSLKGEIEGMVVSSESS